MNEVLQYKTIPVTRHAAHLAKISNLMLYTLDNGFKGEPVEDRERHLTHALKDSKLQIDKAAGKGIIRCSNRHWYKFDYAE